jgi:hypothetical protein
MRVWVGGPVAAAAALVISGALRSEVSAQSSDATIAVAGAESFLGNWTVNVTGDTGPVTMRVALTDNAGRMAARITGGAAEIEGRVVQRISRSQDGALQVAYSLTIQGQAVPTVLTLKPEGATTSATVDLAGGQLVLRGEAKKDP